MIIFRTNKYLLLASIIVVLFFGILVVQKEEKETLESLERISIPPPPDSEKRKVRGFNFETGGWIYYTEEELQIIEEAKSSNSYKQKNE